MGQPLTPAFDEHHPPDAALIGDCVHCGFCLPTCPTYVLWGEEMDSPRGRIDLMKGGLEGDAFDANSVRHLDQCLGCMACVTACPSGVQYDKLIESTRAQLERRAPRTRSEKLLRSMIYGLFPYPKRLKALRGPLRAYQASGLGKVLVRSGVLARLPEGLQAMESLAPRLGPVSRIPSVTPAQGTRRRTVGLLTGCVQGTFFPDVNAATVRVLAAEGCEVVVPQRQGCCGALSAHAGREPESVAFAKADHRGLRGRRHGRRQRRRLRLQPQGVRPPAARRAGLAGSGPRRCRPRSVTSASCSTRWAPSRRAPRCR